MLHQRKTTPLVIVLCKWKPVQYRGKTTSQYSSVRSHIDYFLCYLYTLISFFLFVASCCTHLFCTYFVVILSFGFVWNIFDSVHNIVQASIKQHKIFPCCSGQIQAFIFCIASYLVSSISLFSSLFHICSLVCKNSLVYLLINNSSLYHTIELIFVNKLNLLY